MGILGYMSIYFGGTYPRREKEHLGLNAGDTFQHARSTPSCLLLGPFLSFPSYAPVLPLPTSPESAPTDLPALEAPDRLRSHLPFLVAAQFHAIQPHVLQQYRLGCAARMVIAARSLEKIKTKLRVIGFWCEIDGEISKIIG